MWKRWQAQYWRPLLWEKSAARWHVDTNNEDIGRSHQAQLTSDCAFFEWLWLLGVVHNSIVYIRERSRQNGLIDKRGRVLCCSRLFERDYSVSYKSSKSILTTNEEEEAFFTLATLIESHFVWYNVVHTTTLWCNHYSHQSSRGEKGNASNGSMSSDQKTATPSDVLLLRLSNRYRKDVGMTVYRHRDAILESDIDNRTINGMMGTVQQNSLIK